MKFIFKIFFTCFLMIICYNISSQNSLIESREEREIKLIFKNFFIKKSKISFNLGIDNPLTLPAYFTNYTEYFYRVKDTSKISLFNFVYSNNSKLNKSDCDILNNTILNDTNRLYIEKRWFANNKNIILSDYVENLQKYSSTEYMRPIFFRNYTRCFITVLYNKEMNSFFLKKINSHWVFDRFWVQEIND